MDNHMDNNIIFVTSLNNQLKEREKWTFLKR